MPCVLTRHGTKTRAPKRHKCVLYRTGGKPTNSYPAPARGVKTQKKRETSGWREGGRVEERRRASAEKEKFTINCEFLFEYTFRYPLLKRKLVVLGDVTVCCLSLVDPGHIFSKFYY